MPDSRDKESFLQARFKFTVPQIPTPACAITKTCRVQRAWDGGLPPFSSGSWQEFVKVSRRLHEIAFILNTLNGISCLPYYSTSYVDPTTPLGPFGGSGGGMLVSDVLTHELTKLPSESSALIDNVLMKYDKLNHSEKIRIERILNRLFQAKRRTQIEDKILDLGIALEMLLLQLQDNPYREQLSLSFRLRGSWLMGQSPEDRYEKYRQLREIYEYRSHVAHGGMLCGGEEAKIESVRRSFPEYQRLAEDICRKIITDGNPDWTRLILGKSNSDKTT
jgi:Apea-like HEPN